MIYEIYIRKFIRLLVFFNAYFTSINRRLAVLGAGLMGAGIAQVTVDKGIHTIVKDASQAGLNRGYAQISNGFDNAVKRKRISA